MNRQTFQIQSKFQNYTNSFFRYANERISKLSLSILGNFRYVPKTKHHFQQKKKILKYLKTKYLTDSSQNNLKKFTSYDPTLGDQKIYRKLSQMKNILLRLRTHIESAQEKLSQLKNREDIIKANFYNQVSYEFDRQKYNGIGWGLVIGAIICSTLYRRGSYVRQSALFATCGHGMGQLSYYMNIDKYFDTVYVLFEKDAEEFLKEEQLEQKNQRNKISQFGSIED